MISRICIPILLLFGVSVVLAQGSFAPTVFSPETGHPTKYANSIAEDRNGLMWLSTRSGLFRFDGEAFIPIGEVEGDIESLYGLDIRKMQYFTKGHELWMLPFQASYLLAFDVETFRVRKVPFPTIEGGQSTAANLKKDARGNLLLNIYTGESHHFFKISSNQKLQRICSIDNNWRTLNNINGMDDSNQLYVSLDHTIKVSADGRKSHSILLDSMYDGVGIRRYNRAPFIGLNKIYHWLPNQRQIVASDFNSDGYKLVSDLSEELVPGFGSIRLQDKDGNLWFTTKQSVNYKNSLRRIAPSGTSIDLTPFLRETIFKLDVIIEIIEDRSRNIWIVTSQGVIRFANPKNLFEHFLSSSNKDHFSSPRSLVADENGNLYINARDSLSTSRIHKIPPGKKEAAAMLSKADPGIGSTDPVWLSVLIMDSVNHTIWYLVQWEQVQLIAYRYQSNEWSEFKIGAFKNTFRYIPGIRLLTDNNLLLGGQLGELVHFNTATNEQRVLSLDFPDGKLHEPINNIVNGPNGDVWILAGGELFEVNLIENSVVHYTQEQIGFGIEVEFIVDDENIIWANAKRGGFGRFDPKTGKFKLYSESNGLSNDQVASIMPHKEKLYMGTFSGLSIFDKSTELFQTYSTTDGLTHNEFNYFAKLKTGDGKIYLGGLDGVNAFFPDSIYTQDTTPALQWLEYTTYDNQSDTLITKNNGFSDFSRIYIPPTRSYFELKWLLPDYVRPSGNQYFIRLEGFDKGWQYQGSDNKIRYNSLPAGDYTLHVKGTNPAGAPSTGELELDIRVGQFFYQSNWFLLLVLGGTVGLIYLAIRYHFNQRLKLERMRTRIAIDLHDEVGSSLTHLSMLIGAVDGAGQSESSSAYLKKGNEVLVGAISKIRDVVWAIDSRNDQSGHLIDRMEDFAFDMLRAKGINYRLEIDDIDRKYALPPLLRQNIYLIFKESINNIVKHSNADQVLIEFSKRGRKIYMRIKDNGENLNDQKLKGQGLSNMQLRARRVGGRVEIRQGEGDFEILFESNLLGT